MGNRKHRKPPQPQPAQKSEGRIEKIKRDATGLFAGASQKFENIVISAARAVGFSRAEIWFSCFFHPQNAIDEGKTGHSLVRVLADLLVVYAIYAVVNFITGGYFLYYSGAGNLVAFSGKYTVPDPAIFAASVLVLSPLFDILAWFVIVAFVFALARLLGGKADFTLHAGALSKIFCGSSLILAAFSVPIFGFAALGMRLVDGYSLVGMSLMLIGLLVMIAALLVVLAILAYTLYGYFVALKNAHKISGWRTAGIMILIGILLIAINTFFA